jgi:hypothetical protein
MTKFLHILSNVIASKQKTFGLEVKRLHSNSISIVGFQIPTLTYALTSMGFTIYTCQPSSVSADYTIIALRDLYRVHIAVYPFSKLAVISDYADQVMELYSVLDKFKPQLSLSESKERQTWLVPKSSIKDLLNSVLELYYCATSTDPIQLLRIVGDLKTFDYNNSSKDLHHSIKTLLHLIIESMLLQTRQWL